MKIKKLVEEFSHTVLHGENFKNKIQNLAVAKPKPAATPRAAAAANGVVAPGRVGQYDPSRVYKTPIVPRGPLMAQQQPQAAAPERKISAAVPSPAVRKRPESAGGGGGGGGGGAEASSSSADRRVSPSPRGSYLEQQRLKRAAAEEERLKKKQAELIEKQKVCFKFILTSVGFKMYSI